jgi:protein disulfide-isomerase-like protein
VGWVAPVAERHRGRLVVSLRDAGRYLPALAEDRIDVTSLPRVVIVTPQRKRYIMPDVATPETLPVFLADFLEGRATPVAKSQPPSDAGTLEGLTTLTGETFWREMAGAVDKDVLVEFYAPWCGHCKTLAPIWAELAKTLEAVPTVMIARLDASANDFDEVAFPVAGYPTVFFRRAAKSPSAKPTTPVKYDGPRERAAFLQYLRKHARHPLPLLPDPLVVPPPLPPLNTPPADADDDGRCDL